MAFSQDSFKKAKDILSKRKADAIEGSERRTREIHLRSPEIKEIDVAYSKIGQKLVEAVLLGKSKDETDALISELRDESGRLAAKRASALASLGYPADFTEPKFVCDKCEDSGYDGLNICSCLRRELVRIGYESSGLGALLSKQSFDNFSLKYFSGSEKTVMEQNFTICKNYAEGFGRDSESLLLMGNTGLGKTHLSTSIAGAVIEKGFDVVYETSQNLVSLFSAEQFGRTLPDGSAARSSERYFNCELLIVDDFGTEVINQFSVSCFYNLINTRINKGLPMIINTNLSREEIKNKYTDRIASRLFGEFIVLAFPGKDVRMQKLME